MNIKKLNKLDSMLWDTYMVLDHGSSDECLSKIEVLESHFIKNGKPLNAYEDDLQEDTDP